MWDDPRQLNAVAVILATVAIVLLGWGALDWLARRPAFEIREVVVETPLARVNAAHLEAVIRDELKGTFFTMNLDRGRTALGNVPWVRRVALRRQWPHRLEITVEEHAPLARWNDTALVNTEGEVFAAAYKDALPQFTGPEGTAAEITRRYREWGGALRPLALTIDEMRLTPRGAWHVGLAANGAGLGLELGRDDPGAALARFIDTYDSTVGALARAGTRVEQVDLRYRNGFAVKVPGFRERPAKKAA